MALRWRRRLAFGPLHVNLNPPSGRVGISIGVRGARGGIDGHGRPYGSVGLPGTGLSWYTRQGAHAETPGGYLLPPDHAQDFIREVLDPSPPAPSRWPRWRVLWVIFAVLVGLLVALLR